MIAKHVSNISEYLFINLFPILTINVGKIAITNSIGDIANEFSIQGYPTGVGNCDWIEEEII